MSKPKQKTVQQFINTLTILRRIISRLSTSSLEEKMATLLQFQALSYLKNNCGSSVGDLARELSLSSPAIAQLTERLVTAKRIERKDDQEDRRIVRLFLTREGALEHSLMEKRYLEKMTSLLNLIPDVDLKQLIRIQTELIKKLEECNK